MARDFNGTTQYLQYDGNIPGSPPFTLAAWGNSDDDTVGQHCVAISAITGGEKMLIGFGGGAAGDPVQISITDSGGTTTTPTTTGYTANQWHHACGVFAATNDRRVYIDGGSKATSSESRTPASLVRTNIGCSLSSGVPTVPYNGSIAEVGIWNVALTDAEVAILAAGYPPPLVRPESLVAYWSLIGRTSPEIDVVGGYDMTLNAAPTTVEHPDIITPAGPLIEYPRFDTPINLLTLHPLQAVPTTSNPATLGLRNRHPHLAFDDTTAESAVFDFVMPKTYSGSDITVVLHSAAATATSGNAKVGVSLERIGDSQQDVDSDGFAGVNNKVFIVADVSGYIKQTKIRFTAGADMDSVAAGEKFRLKVTRLADETNDDLSGDWQLYTVDIRGS